MPRKDAPAGPVPALTAVPAARSNAAVLRVRVALVLGLLVLAALAGVLSAAAWVTQKPPPPDLSPAIPRGQGIAALVAEAFLAGKDVPIPIAEGVPPLTGSPGPLAHEPPRWSGFSPVRLPSGVRIETHRFVFYRLLPPVEGDESPVRQLNQLTVMVTFDEENGGGAVLGARPSFMPLYRPDAAQNTYPGKGVDLPGEVIAQLTKWASAWAEADYEELRQLSGDGTPDAAYLSLGGFTATKLVVLNAVPSGSGPNSWLVRSRISLQGSNGYSTEMDLDLTVEGAPPNPTYVIGWGPAGSGLRDTEDVRVPTPN